jgi:hypothetical protein
MKLFDFVIEYGNELTIVDKLRSEGLLRTTMQCPKCNESMIERKKTLKDSLAFRCSRRACQLERSIRTGSFFENVRLSLCEAVLLIHLWCAKYSEKLICEEFQFSRPTVIDWFRFCRELCISHYEENAAMIGGQGSIVEIDETYVVKRKNNQGRVLTAGWLFGGIERREDDEFRAFFRLIYNRSGPHLKYLIRQHVAPGTRIVTDGWAGYNGLAELGYEHSVVIHEENFVSPSDTETHTQRIEATWGSLKRFLRQRGTNKGEFLAEYICEYIFRRQYGDVFSAVLDVIRNKYTF